jgi:hypothetical protein
MRPQYRLRLLDNKVVVRKVINAPMEFDADDDVFVVTVFYITSHEVSDKISD